MTEIFTDQSFADALRVLATLYMKGRFSEGEVLARDVTTRFPRQGMGWKILGIILTVQGKHGESLEPLQKAAALLPGDAEAHCTLGVALRALGRPGEAEGCYRKAVKIKPDYAEAHNNLGNTLCVLHRHDEGEPCFRRALEIVPDYPEAHNNLGAALRVLGRLEEAEACFRRAARIRPDYRQAHVNLALTLQDLGRLEEAVSGYRIALEINPDCTEAHNNMGVALSKLGYPRQAEASYRLALAVKPDNAEAHSNLGSALEELGRLEEALESHRRALSINPGYPEGHNNMGNALKALGRMREAEASYRRALAIRPDYGEAHCNLAGALGDLGRNDEAVASCRRALMIRPDYMAAHSNLLFALAMGGRDNMESYLEAATTFGQAAASKVDKPYTHLPGPAHPARLRVGFVSGDLNNHPVGYFLENVLARIDPSRLDLVAYPASPKTDDLTARIKPFFSAWRSLVGLNDKAAAALIRSDGIHVLFDCSGHTSNNRLPMFAWKPAPLQVSWPGYFASTGISAMDYILGDPYVTPIEEEGHFTETVWRLPETYLCFSPPRAPVEVGPLPALSSGFITFGSFNNLARVTEAVVDLWSRVLVAIPASRLFLKAKQLNDPAAHDTIRRRFAHRGIDPRRLLLEGASPRAKMLEAYNRVDVILSPFPYGGGTTSLEGLWMGAPALVRRGTCFLSHIGETIACNAGPAEWIAKDDDHYVALAVMHTKNPDRLALLRGNLRQQALASPLFDAPGFAKHLEAALFGMWKERRQKP